MEEKRKCLSITTIVSGIILIVVWLLVQTKDTNVESQTTRVVDDSRSHKLTPADDHVNNRSNTNETSLRRNIEKIDLNNINIGNNSTRSDVDQDNVPEYKYIDTMNSNYKQTLMSPHLILLGPSKSGTSTFGEKFGDFIDIEYYGKESHNAIKPSCVSHIVWQKIVHQREEINFTNYTKNQVEQMRSWVIQHTSQESCHLSGFNQKWKTRNIQAWNQQRVKKGLTKLEPPSCAIEYDNNDIDYSNVENYKRQVDWFDQYYEKINSNINYNKYNESRIKCWLIEKFVGLVDTFAPAIMYSTYFPKLKVFTIFRNPTDRLVSRMHFGVQEKKYLKMKQILIEKNMTREQYVYHTHFYDSPNITKSTYYKLNHEIDQQCLLFSQLLDWIEINQSNYDNKYSDNNNYNVMSTIMSAQRDVVDVFVSRAAYDSRQRGRGGNEFDRPLTAWMIYWIYVYDIMFGYDNWNQFRIIQFDWLYGDVPRGLGAIKCWLQLNKQISIENELRDIRRIDIFEHCPEIYFNNKEYFKGVNDKIVGSTTKRAHGEYHSDPLTKIDRLNYDKMFYPCTKALVSLIKKRRNILLGQWHPWSLNITL